MNVLPWLRRVFGLPPLLSHLLLLLGLQLFLEILSDQPDGNHVWDHPLPHPQSHFPWADYEQRAQSHLVEPGRPGASQNPAARNPGPRGGPFPPAGGGERREELTRFSTTLWKAPNMEGYFDRGHMVNMREHLGEAQHGFTTLQSGGILEVTLDSDLAGRGDGFSHLRRF